MNTYPAERPVASGNLGGTAGMNPVPMRDGIFCCPGRGEMAQIFVYDTTLRDGTQGEHVALTLEDKLRIAQKLDEFRIDYIEGGWPGSNPKDSEFFAQARTLSLHHARITALGDTRRAGDAADPDEGV